MRTFLRCLLVLIGFTFAEHSNGQLNDFLFGPFKEKKTVTYGLNNRRTSLLNENTTLYGGYIGIKFGGQLKHVITLNSTVFWVGEYDAPQGLQPTEVQLNYAGFAEEYVFWRYQKWAFSSYIHLGAGKGRFRTASFDNYPFATHWIFPAELGLQTGYSLNKWLELKAGGGYRYVMNAGDWPLHGFYYKLGAGLNFQEFKKSYAHFADLFQQLKPTSRIW